MADILGRLPADRVSDVVLIEPGDEGAVVGLNPLHGATEQAERRADELLQLFRDLFGSAIGPRSSDLLLHALITIARLPGGNLADIPALLTNAGFRRQTLSRVSEPLVLAPFWAWFDNLSAAERGQVIAPLMNKLRVFVARAALRRLLGQAEPRFQLDKLFTARPIVLVNLNKGLVGPETARLIGCLLLSQLWQAIQRRAAVAHHQRYPVSVIVDEWQDYTAALDFGDVLAQARGLGVGFTLAHQHLIQLSPTLRAAVLANARSRIVFRPAQDDAKALAGVLGGGLTGEDLEALGAYQTCVRLQLDGQPTPPFGVQTEPLPAAADDLPSRREAARQRYGIDGADVDAELTQRWEAGKRGSAETIGIRTRRPSE